MYYQQILNNNIVGIYQSDFILNDSIYKLIEEDSFIQLSQIYSINYVSSKLYFTSIESLVIYYYNYLYPLYIKELIKVQQLTSKWLNIESLIPTKVAIEHLNRNLETFQFTNEYLNELLKNDGLISLGQNILNEGMYFPFLGGNENVGYGSHRVLSLQALNQIIKINRPFLFLQFNDDIIKQANYSHNQHSYIGQVAYPITIYLPDMATRIIYSIVTTNIHTIWYIFTYISDIIGENIYNVKDSIKPNPIFNNPELFEEFINGNK